MSLRALDVTERPDVALDAALTEAAARVAALRCADDLDAAAAEQSLARYRSAAQLTTAYLLVSCPRCKSFPGLPCQTRSGFYGGASGPHKARRDAVAAMSGPEIAAGWVALRDAQAATRAACNTSATSALKGIR